MGAVVAFVVANLVVVEIEIGALDLLVIEVVVMMKWAVLVAIQVLEFVAAATEVVGIDFVVIVVVLVEAVVAVDAMVQMLVKIAVLEVVAEVVAEA
jgi:hypothetical protein